MHGNRHKMPWKCKKYGHICYNEVFDWSKVFQKKSALITLIIEPQVGREGGTQNLT